VKKVKNLKFLFGLSAFKHIVDGPIRGFIEKKNPDLFYNFLPKRSFFWLNLPSFLVIFHQKIVKLKMNFFMFY
jgi:hypothetical protein